MLLGLEGEKQMGRGLGIERSGGGAVGWRQVKGWARRDGHHAMLPDYISNLNLQNSITWTRHQFAAKL